MLLAPTTVLLLVFVVFLAGMVNGIAGFGFALVGTMLLATIVDPATAVVTMILPILAANVVLAADLSIAELRTCGRRFSPLLVSTVIGTIVGMIVLDALPDAALRVGLGFVTLAFVGAVQQTIPIPGFERAKSGCFVETPIAMVGVGGLSGLLFGGTNVGVQLVAYVRSCNLSHGLFVGVLAIVFVGVNGVRVIAALLLGLYPDLWVLALSIGAAVPGVAGVVLGKRIRGVLTDSRRTLLVLGLLTIIGIRLVLGGFGVV